jgi:hypothetical protein
LWVSHRRLQPDDYGWLLLYELPGLAPASSATVPVTRQRPVAIHRPGLIRPQFYRHGVWAVEGYLCMDLRVLPGVRHIMRYPLAERSGQRGSADHQHDRKRDSSDRQSSLQNPDSPCPLAREVEVQMAGMHEQLARDPVERAAAPDDMDLAVSVGEATTRLDVATSTDPAVETEHKVASQPVAKLPAPPVGATDPLLVVASARIGEPAREMKHVMALVERVSDVHPEVLIEGDCGGNAQGDDERRDGHSRDEPVGTHCPPPYPGSPMAQSPRATG